jgi:hypothetical protein
VEIAPPREKAGPTSRKRTETPFFEEPATEAAWEIGPGRDKPGKVIRKISPRRRHDLEKMTSTLRPEKPPKSPGSQEFLFCAAEKLPKFPRLRKFSLPTLPDLTSAYLVRNFGIILQSISFI